MTLMCLTNACGYDDCKNSRCRTVAERNRCACSLVLEDDVPRKFINMCIARQLRSSAIFDGHCNLQGVDDTRNVT